jgi:hypothetical protein
VSSRPDLLGQIVRIGGLDALRATLAGALRGGDAGLRACVESLLDAAPPPAVASIPYAPTAKAWQGGDEGQGER